MKAVQLFRVGLCQSPREEVRLFLIISLNRHAIARKDQSFESLDDRLLRQYSTVRKTAGGSESFRLSLPPGAPRQSGRRFFRQRIIRHCAMYHKDVQIVA